MVAEGLEDGVQVGHVPAVEELEVLPLDPARTPGGVPPGHLDAVLELLLGEVVGPGVGDVLVDLLPSLPAFVSPEEIDNCFYFARTSVNLSGLTAGWTHSTPR